MAEISSSTFKEKEIGTTDLSVPQKDESVNGSTVNDPEPYSAFSKTRKYVIVTIITFAGVISPLTGTIYAPSLKQIQEDLNTTEELVNLTVSMYMVFQGLSPLFWAAFADVYGRRPIYIMSMVVFVGASLGLAFSKTYWLLLVLRMLQAIGSSPVVAIGAGTISDIVPPAERGSYLGWFTVGPLFGPLIGPMVGGLLAERWGWHSIFFFLSAIGIITAFVIFFFLPETLRTIVGNGSIPVGLTPIEWLKLNIFNRSQKKHYEITHPEVPQSKRAVPNPLASFLFLRKPGVALVLISNAIFFADLYCINTPQGYLYQDIYGLTEGQVGLTYLPAGVGNIIGSLVTGRLLDMDYKHITSKLEPGEPVPLERARFRTFWFGASLNLAFLIIYAWILQVKVNLAAVLVIQFLIGFSLISIINSYTTYIVDCIPGRSASITGVNNVMRCITGALAILYIQPLIDLIGLGWAYTLNFFLCFLSILPIIMVVRNGEAWRDKKLQKS